VALVGSARAVAALAVSEVSEVSEGAAQARRHGLQLWDALHVIKGGVRLRMTALPGRGDGAPGMLLDFTQKEAGKRGPSYRIYVSGEPFAPGDIEDIPRRYPGADLVLLPLAPERAASGSSPGCVLGRVVETGRHGARVLALLVPQPSSGDETPLAAPVAYLPADASYRFRAVKR